METQNELDRLDEAMNNLNAYLNGNDSIPNLHANLVFLQIYATYGLRLPSNAVALENALTLSARQAAEYSWFDLMWKAYGFLGQASEYFFTEVFDKMTSLGERLKSYSHDAAGKDSVFDYIITLVKPVKGTTPDPLALDILKDLNSAALKNADLAGEIKSNLTSYKMQLNKVLDQLANVKKLVEASDSVSEEQIKKLNGGKEVLGSLKQLTNLLAKENKAYEHNVVVASTTVTYSWVAYPLGLIAAATVAGIFGKNATALKHSIDKLEVLIKEANHDLTVALNTQNTVKLAEDSLNNVINHTSIAIEKTAQIQDIWKTVASGLEYISDKFEGCIKTEEGEEKLAAINSIVYYMKKAQEKWTVIQPSIDKMMENIYIKVEEQNFSLSAFADKVIEEASKQEAA